MKLAAAGAYSDAPTPLYSFPKFELPKLRGSRANTTVLYGDVSRGEQLSDFWLEGRLLANLERLKKLNQYLDNQVASGNIAEANKHLYIFAIVELIATFDYPGIGVPDALPGPEGQMIYNLRRLNDSIQLDVFSNGEAEFYFAPKNSREDVLIEYSVGSLAEAVRHSGFSIPLR